MTHCCCATVRSGQPAGDLRIHAWLYSNFATQAEKRMFNLRKRLQEAPFLRGQGLVEFVAVPTRTETDLFAEVDST